jgi:hypothetical protein
MYQAIVSFDNTGVGVAGSQAFLRPHIMVGYQSGTLLALL